MSCSGRRLPPPRAAPPESPHVAPTFADPSSPSPSTPADTATAIVRLLLAAGWALDLQPWLDVEGLRWLAHANDCGQHNPAQEVEVESELHSDATEAWRELGARALLHLGAADAERLRGLLG